MEKYRKRIKAHQREYLKELIERIENGEPLLSAGNKEKEAYFSNMEVGIASEFAKNTKRVGMNTVKHGLEVAGIDWSEDLQRKNAQEQFNEILRLNVQLIRDARADILEKVQNTIQDGFANGLSLKDLKEQIQKVGDYSDNRAKLIAYDQTRKAQGAYCISAYNKAGVSKFKWIHSGGGVPRKLHKQYNGKIFDYNNPPIIDEKTGVKGYPSQLINCKCQMIPIWDDEVAPPKVEVVDPALDDNLKRVGVNKYTYLGQEVTVNPDFSYKKDGTLKASAKEYIMERATYLIDRAFYEQTVEPEIVRETEKAVMLKVPAVKTYAQGAGYDWDEVEVDIWVPKSWLVDGKVKLSTIERKVEEKGRAYRTPKRLFKKMLGVEDEE